MSNSNSDSFNSESTVFSNNTLADLCRSEMPSSDSEEDPSKRSFELSKWVLNFEDVS